MSRPTLDDLLRTETDRIEWKQSAKDGDGVVEAVCALANDLGNSGTDGYVVVGVTKDGHIVGVGDVDQASRGLGQRLYDITLQPTPIVDIQPQLTDKGWVLVVAVQPYPVPPVIKFRGVARVRVGTMTRKATDAEVARLGERRPENAKPFDIRAINDATVDELDTTLEAASYGEARRQDGDPATFPSFTEWLVRQELGRIVDKRFAPNASAVLLHGKDPQTRFPGAIIDVARYGGVDVDAPVVDRLRATGTLPNQLEVVRRRLATGMVERPTEKRGMIEAFEPEYPLPALEELLRNMVQHRAYDVTHAPSRIEWFDDRIVFTNPGGPYGQAGQGEFGEHSDYRNPTLTRHLAALGFVQQLGRGVRRVRSLLSKHGHPPLMVEVDGYTRITVGRRP